ncbi:hypothetical protein DFH06DRAFT_1123518 [Mycena polygramma]|nr:hypothetical protein DFH06DRAFT_1123518 [Mycena polygramma]
MVYIAATFGYIGLRLATFVYRGRRRRMWRCWATFGYVRLRSTTRRSQTSVYLGLPRSTFVHTQTNRRRRLNSKGFYLECEVENCWATPVYLGSTLFETDVDQQWRPT